MHVLKITSKTVTNFTPHERDERDERDNLPARSGILTIPKCRAIL